MRIKIKDPRITPNHKDILITGLFSIILLAFFGVYATLGPFPPRCQDSNHLTCLLEFLFPVSIPLIAVSTFIYSLWLKYAKFRAPLPGTYFTYMTFTPDGVLLEKPNPAQNVFFPYKGTSLRVTIHVQKYSVRGRSRVHFEKIEFTFTQKEGAREKIQLFPPRHIMPFLCKILDRRTLFHKFSYHASTRSNREEAQSVLKKMDTYCERGFMPIFDSKYERNVYFLLGVLMALGAVWTFFSIEFLFLFFLSVRFLGRPLKEMYLEHRAAKKQKARF